MTTTNQVVLSMLLLKHIKQENNQSLIEIVLDPDTPNLKLTSLSERYLKQFRPIHGQKNAFRMETETGDLIILELIKNLRSKAWSLMTSHAFTHFAIQKIVESDFYFERVTSPTGEYSYIPPQIKEVRPDPVSYHANHDNAANIPSLEQKNSEEKTRVNPSPVVVAQQVQSVPPNSHPVSQSRVEEAGHKSPEPGSVNYTGLVRTDPEKQPKPVTSPEVVALILDKTSHTNKGPYGFASRPSNYVKRREPGHEDDEDLSNIPSVASKSGSNQDLRELQRQEEARAHPPAPVPANLFPQQLPPQHLQPQHPPAVEEQRRPSQTEGAAKKLDEKRPSFTDAASSTTMKERRPSFTIIETGKKPEVKVEVKTAAALLFKDDSEEKAAPPAAAPAAAPAPATTSSSAANIAVAASSSVSVPLLNKVNRLEIVVTETNKVPAVKPPGSNATTPVAAAQAGKTEPPAVQPAPVSRKPSLLKSAYSELIAKKEEKKLDEKKPSFIIPSKPSEAKKAAAAAATTTTEPPKETTPVPSPKNADQPQPTAANVTAPVTSHYVEPKPVPGHHPAHHPLSSSSSSGKHAHEEHPPKAHVPEEEQQETQRPLSTTISSNKPFSSSAPAPASAPVREEPPKVETQPVKADNRLSKSLSFKLFGSATAAEPAIQPEKVEEKAADQPAAVLSSSGALGSKSQEEAKVPTYRRASDAVNKLFNKYQPNKKKTEEPAPAPVPSAQDKEKEKEKEREAERQREEQERIQKEKERELEREREKERERQRLEEEKERERVEREKQKALEVEKQREAERIAREKELEQEREREKEKAKANVHLKDPVGGDDAPFLRKNPSPALAFPPKAMSYDETTPKKMHGDIHQDGFVASTTHTEEKSPLQLNNGTSPVPSSRDDLTISPSSGEKSPAASSFLENLKRIKEGGAASSPPPQSSGPAITTSSLKKPLNFPAAAAAPPPAGGEGEEDEFGFSGSIHLALKKSSEPVDEEHESSRTQHYSKLGSAFVSGNVLNRGRGGRGMGGRGRGL